MNAQAIASGMGGDTSPGQEEFIMESLWRRHSRHYAAALLILLLFGFGVFKLLDPRTLPIKQVSVKGDFQHLSTAGLQERANEAVRGGFFNVNVEAIQKLLLEEPWIREVSVKRIWPDKIMVSIREQAAVAQWNDGALLNDNAQIFSPETDTFPKNIPLLRGPENTHVQMLSRYQHLQAALPEELRIAEITLSDRRSWHIGFVDGPHVYLGRTNVERRIARFIDHVPGKLGDHFDRIRSIDMRYTNGFAVRWEPDYKPDL